MDEADRGAADPHALALATELGAQYRDAGVDLDEGVPFDIYELFLRVTFRDYNHRSPDDELAILRYARAFEDAAVPLAGCETG